LSEQEIRIDPLNDLLFKKMLATEEQKPILQGFIKDFFDMDVALEEMILVTPYSIKSYQENLKIVADTENHSPDDVSRAISIMRETQRDITIVVKKADLLVELQIYNDKYFLARSVYYLCDRFCSNYNLPGKMETHKDGKLIRYSSLRPVYAMNIVKKEYFSQDDDAIHIFGLYDKDHEMKMNTDYLMLGYFELTKKTVRNLNQEHWRTFFLTEKVHSDAPDYIKQAKNLIAYVNLSEEERKILAEQEKAETIYDSIMFTVYEEGREEGEIKKGIRAAVNNVIIFHCSITMAMEAAELDPKYRDDVIAELKKKGIDYTDE